VAVLSFIISASTLYWNSLRGPRIICANNRIFSLAQTRDGAIIGLWLTFSNIGSTTGVVESLFLILDSIPYTSTKEFIAYNEGFDPSVLNPVPATKRPVLPFAIKSGESTIKQILFTNQGFIFKKGIYQLRVYCILSNENRARQSTTKRLKLIEDFEDGRVNTSIEPIATEEIQIPFKYERLDYWRFI
jgi:hypothetical protein